MLYPLGTPIVRAGASVPLFVNGPLYSKTLEFPGELTQRFPDGSNVSASDPSLPERTNAYPWTADARSGSLKTSTFDGFGPALPLKLITHRRPFGSTPRPLEYPSPFCVLQS